MDLSLSFFGAVCACTASLAPAQTPLPAHEPAAESTRHNFPRLVFSFNKGSGISATQWNVLTRYADLALGLDGHGYEFPGYLDDFRLAAPSTPVFGFITAMAIQRVGTTDARFKQLDHTEDAFLHCADPASLEVVIAGGATRLFWVRDHRKDASSSYPSPIGVTSYTIESAPSSNGPWVVEGSPIPDGTNSYYDASVASPDPTRWYRVRTKLADTAALADFSWPAQPDPAAAGFAYLKIFGDLTFRAGVWGNGPVNASGVVLEIGNQSGWGYTNAATSIAPPVNGITEYLGTLSSYPSGGAWVMRLRSVPQGFTSMKFEIGRRNNRILDSFGAHVFKPDHPQAVAMHGARVASMQALGLTGARVDFALDSFPSWYVASTPAGLDSSYVSIEPHVLALLSSLQASHPQMRLFLNGLSVTSTYAGILDYVPPGDGVDCEYIGWSSPSQTEPFRDGDMLDGVIAAAHVRRKTVACYSYAAASDVEARITSLARYWLVFAPHVYFQYMTADYHQSVDYFPEYDIELGPPLKPWLASRADITVGPIYARHFARGFALYNPGSASVPVSFPAPMYVVSATGAHSSKQGGTGQVVFLGPTHSTTLAPKRGAIVVRYPWTSR